MVMNMYRQYGISKDKEIKNTSNKTISRQIGGMKAQGVTSTIVEVNGQDVSIPRMEYVELLENQVKDLRERITRLEKQLITTNNRLQKNINSQKHENMMRR